MLAETTVTTARAADLESSEKPYYSEKQIRKAWKRATRRIEDGLDPTIEVLLQELNQERREAERVAESGETFTLGQLREAIAGPDGTWDISYYDAIVRIIMKGKE